MSWNTSATAAAVGPFYLLIICIYLCLIVVSGKVNHEKGGTGLAAQLVSREERVRVFESEYGSISAVDIGDGTGTGTGTGRSNNYHLQFINMEPNSLFLPVLLHSHMLFYVRSGSGKLSWIDDDEKTNEVNLQRGDLYTLHSETLFYLNSIISTDDASFLPDETPPTLRIVAIFADPDEEQDLQGPSVGPYSSISQLVRGFDNPVLQSAFQVPEEVIQELTKSTTDGALIVPADQQREDDEDEEFPFIRAMFGMQRYSRQASASASASVNKKKKYTKTFNFFKEEPDFENCNGWSRVVTKHDLRALRGSQIGVYMVNLNAGSMMGPHWNPSSNEVLVVIEGEGKIQVVCASALTNKDCENSRFRVGEGDVLTVPRFHPVAQMSFNDGPLVFMGFSTISKKNKPQFLVGKDSFLQTLDKGILGVAFNVSNTTVGQLTRLKRGSILLDCTSCADEGESETGKRGKGEGEGGGRQEEEERWERREEGSEEERGRKEGQEEEEEVERQREDDRPESERREEKSEEEEERGRREEPEEEVERQREEERRPERERHEESERRGEELEEEMGRRGETEGVEEEEEAGREWI